jgi:hypothetical protein
LAGLAEQAFWYAAIALHVLLAWRMWRLRLAARYPVIFALLLMQLVRSLWLTQFLASPHRDWHALNRYSFTILFTEPVLIAARAAAVFEICAGVLQSYRGLSIVSRLVMFAALSISVAASILLHWPEFSFAGERFPLLRLQHLLETTVYSALLVILLLLALFVLYHPAPIRRNLLAHGIGFSFYMLSTSAALWLRNLDASQWTRAASTLRLGISVAGLALWAWMLSPRGEEETVDVHVPLSPETEQRVLARLEALNSALERK